MQGKVFKIDVLQEIANRVNKSISQVVLRWDIQMGVVTIPKSVTPERIRENFDVFDFTLSDEDMKMITNLDKNERTGPHPDKITF